MKHKIYDLMRVTVR